MRSFHFLVNPVSGGGKAPAAVLPVARLLRDAGADVEVTYSRGPDECAALVAGSAAAGRVVVAAGGDGMVSSLVGAVVAADAVLGIVPAGRGNDFARQLGLDAEPASVARVLLEAPERRVDVIDVAGAVVAGSVYAGVDSVASQVVERVRFLPGRLQYPYAAVRALATYQPAAYSIIVDGVLHRHRAATVVVANSGYYGSGMHIAPEASVEDGLLEVVVICAASRWSLIRSMPKVYDGSHVGLDQVFVLRGREVTLSADRGVAAYADGEPLATLPVTARVLPAALRVLA